MRVMEEKQGLGNLPGYLEPGIPRKGVGPFFAVEPGSQGSLGHQGIKKAGAH